MSGPTNLHTQHTGIRVKDVTTADEMYKAVLKYAETADIWVFAAAVADYRPKVVADKKIKKLAKS
ncbi:hypothetical protein GCM10028895_23320 [Pontibacter rugosus]